MRLFELVLQNIPPQRIAREFIECVSTSDDDSISVILKHFLHSIMDAIGFKYYVTTDEISNMEFRWPEQDAMGFTFHHERTIFERYGVFLEETCKIMNQASLLESLIKIVDVFLSLCNSMEAPWEENFQEPLSLISFSLLRSMHQIRKTLDDRSFVLDNVCHQLFETCQQGLGFPDSHDTIFKGLCLLLEKNYDYFTYFDENVLKFYTNCMEYAICGSSGALFIHMRNAIENSRISNEPRVSLIEFLADSNMIKAYCAFAEHSSRNVVASLLKFLNTLLSHLPILECFTRDQLHIIFGNALQKNQKIRSMAVDFYTTFMQKSFRDKLILRDILDFYLSKADGIDFLDDFIGSLWDKFPYMTNFGPYLRILGKTEWNLKILSITAQFTIRIYKKLYNESENNDDYALRLSEVLHMLPTLFEALEDKWQVRGILLDVYSLTDPEVAIATIKDFPIAADRFVSYSLNYLKKYDEDYTVVQNTIVNMLKLMDFFNMQDEMQHFADSVYVKYKDLMSNPSELTDDEVKALQHTLVLLSAITDTSSALNEEHLFELVSDLGTRLIDSNILQDLSAKHNCFLDSFGILTYSGCLNILSYMCAQITPDESNIESTVLFNQAYPFLKYLLQRLAADKQPEVGIIFAETAIRSLCDIYIIFNFKLERHVYHILVNCVNVHVFEAAPTDNQLRQLELQRNILHCFNLLHKYVEIPTAITWKVVIHYGLASNFETELTELMDILYEYNSEKFTKPSLFTYVIPVAIYNLFQRQARVGQFNNALKAYKRYVEAKVPDGTQRVMKIHIVLTMIDMIERAIKGGDIQQQSNRMELLTNMRILLTDVYQSDSNLIVSQSRRLERHSLTQNEMDTLTSFQERLSQ